MQNKIQRNLKKKLFLALCAGSLLLADSVIANSSTANSFSKTGDPVKEKTAKKKKLKKISTRKRSAVKIYKDVSKQNIHIYTKKNDREQINFFVFDLDGTLVQNYQMNANDHRKITGMKKGTYIYRAFCGDEETAAGKIEIK